MPEPGGRQGLGQQLFRLPPQPEAIALARDGISGGD
jgi:hypothetical protein